MNQNINNDGMTEETQRAVSLYGQNDGVEDFPVLKAFQQYIDAEQEKARKRIIWLGIFFGVILAIVVAVFLFLLHGINARNQVLSDRCLEYVMKQAETKQTEARKSPSVVLQPPVQVPVARPNDAVLKSMTDTLVALQKQIQDDRAANRAAANAKASEPINPIFSSKVLIETEKLDRAKAKLDAEKKELETEKRQLEAERERLRQIEIDRQRRKLYPELYEAEGVVAPSRRNRSTRALTDDDIREIIREAYSDEDEETAKSEKLPTTNKVSEPKKETPGGDDGAVEYFKDDDYSIPVGVKGSSSKIKFTVPVD